MKIKNIDVLKRLEEDEDIELEPGDVFTLPPGQGKVIIDSIVRPNKEGPKKTEWRFNDGKQRKIY